MMGHCETNLCIRCVFSDIKHNIRCLNLEQVDVVLSQGFCCINFQDFTERNFFVVVGASLGLTTVYVDYLSLRIILTLNIVIDLESSLQ